MIGAQYTGNTLNKPSGFPTFLELKRGIVHIKFLLKNSTCNEIHKIEMQLSELSKIALELNPDENTTLTDRRYNELIEQRKILTDWMKKEIEGLNDLFKDYLDFKKP